MSKQVDGAFIRALQEYDSGNAITEASEAIRLAVDAVRRFDKAAVVSIDIKIEPTGKNALVLSAEITSKLPKETPHKSVFFHDDSNNLFRNNPQQPEMELKPVESAQPAPELQKVS